MARMKQGSLKAQLGINETISSKSAALRVARMLRQNIAAGKYEGELRDKAVAYANIYRWNAENKFGKAKPGRKPARVARKASSKKVTPKRTRRAPTAKRSPGRPKGTGLAAQVEALKSQLQALMAKTNPPQDQPVTVPAPVTQPEQPSATNEPVLVPIPQVG